MTKIEINTFIEAMQELGDDWTSEEVMSTYGNSSLQEALDDRRKLLSMGANIIGTILNRNK